MDTDSSIFYNDPYIVSEMHGNEFLSTIFVNFEKHV